jgi:hypothetical protein
LIDRQRETPIIIPIEPEIYVNGFKEIALSGAEYRPVRPDVV